MSAQHFSTVIRRVGAAMLAALACAAGAGAQTPDAPDISGVWQAYASVSEPGAGSPSTPQGRAMVDAFYDQYGDDMPEAGWYCVPAGMPGVMMSTVSYPVEIIQSPGRITMLHELEMQIRRIFMDGREFPPDNYWKSRQGYSIAHWEGDELVIETRLLNEYLSRRWPRTENSRVVERIHRANRSDVNVVRNGYPPENDSEDLLVVEITLTDPTLYTAPQHATMYYQRVSDAEFLEYDCAAALWEEALEKALD